MKKSMNKSVKRSAKKGARQSPMRRIASVLLAALLLLGTALAEGGFPAAQDLPGGRLVIEEAGEYTLTGSMRGTVYVDPGEGDVTLILDNASICGGNASGIVAVSGDSLTIELAEGTVNSVTECGFGDAWHAAIYSAVDLTFTGGGQLRVSDNQCAGVRVDGAGLAFCGGVVYVTGGGAGIEADRGYTVNGGTLLALDDNRIQQPRQDAGQQVVSVTLMEPIPQGSSVTLVNADSGEQVSFDADVDFQSLIISSPALTEGEYQVFVDVTPEPMDHVETPELPAVPMNGQPDNGGERPELPEGQGQPDNGERPELPEGQDQPNDGERPELPEGQSQQPGGMNGSRPDNLPDDMPGDMPGGMPGNMGGVASTADAPGEIVTSAAENSAASLEADYDNATTITMSDDNSQVKITSGGTYVVTGSSSDGNITVKKSTTGVVLVLDNLDLTSTTGAPLAINKEAEVRLVITGSVSLTDAENPDDEESADADVADAFDGAAIKIKADANVYLTGDGRLTLNGEAKNGIKTGDNALLTIDGDVTIDITAANDGINANYDLNLLGGDITIDAADDAVHADRILTIGREGGAGPKLTVVNSKEGLEGTVVNIFGGEVSVNAADDAINAANKDGAYEGELNYAVNVTGGRITVNAGGDGMDSNGDVNLIGGSAIIHSANNGGEAGIDYDGQLYISDEFKLNNQSGVAGSDGMPGGVGGQMPGGMGGNNGQPGQMSGGNSQQPGGQRPGGMGNR